MEVFCMIVVKAQIKEVAKEFNVSGDFAETLDKKVVQIVHDACERARANNRRTVMAKDL
jgi:histone H3/H4